MNVGSICYGIIACTILVLFICFSVLFEVGSYNHGALSLFIMLSLVINNISWAVLYNAKKLELISSTGGYY